MVCAPCVLLRTMRFAHCCWCFLAVLACTTLCTATPEVTQHPSDHTTYPGETFSLMCTASGATFQGWVFENGAELMKITANDVYDTTNTEASSSLTIKAFKKELAGRYRCLFTTEGFGSILTKPATVKHYTQPVVMEQPKDFQSYVSTTGDGMDYRNVFAFQCSFEPEPSSIMPIITWEQCNPDNTYTPINKTAHTVFAPGYDETADIHTVAYIFFQTESTGYLQIHDTNNTAYLNAQYRCKASSSVSQDTQPPVYSDCAAVIHHPYTENKPDDFPFFSTVPFERLYFDVGHLPVMACTTQQQTDSLPPKLLFEDELIGLSFVSLLSTPLHFNSSHIELLGELNLQFNGTAAVDMDIYEQTFTCQVQHIREVRRYNTTFYRDRPLCPVSTVSTNPFVNYTFREDDTGELSLQLKENSPIQQSRVFNDGEVAVVKSEVESDNSRILVTIDPVMPHHEGVVQVEVENRASIFTEYYRVHVQLKARAVSEDQTVVGRVTQTLMIECKATGNLEDASFTFDWELGDKVKESFNVSATDGMATSTYMITGLSMENHEQTLECHPSNKIGNRNFTQFKISVELFPPPNVTKFAFQPDRKDALDIEWLPVDVTGYPGASVEKYYLELARDKDGSAIVDSTFVPAGGNASHVFTVDECSPNYWVRIKAVNGNQDVTSFSGWVNFTIAVKCPVVATPGPLPGWSIFLIVLLILLFCLLCLFLLCLLLFCCKRRRDPKGVYLAERREKIYQADKASYRALQAHECATLAKMS